MNSYFKYLLGQVLDFKRHNCAETVPAAELSLVVSLCRLLDIFATKENGLDPSKEEDQFDDMARHWFLFW